MIIQQQYEEEEEWVDPEDEYVQRRSKKTSQISNIQIQSPVLLTQSQRRQPKFSDPEIANYQDVQIQIQQLESHRRQEKMLQKQVQMSRKNSQPMYQKAGQYSSDQQGSDTRLQSTRYRSSAKQSYYTPAREEKPQIMYQQMNPKRLVDIPPVNMQVIRQTEEKVDTEPIHYYQPHTQPQRDFDYERMQLGEQEEQDDGQLSMQKKSRSAQQIEEYIREQKVHSHQPRPRVKQRPRKKKKKKKRGVRGSKLNRRSNGRSQYHERQD